MDGDGFLSDILLDGRDAEVGGLDDLTIPMTQDTQEVDAQVQPSRSTRDRKGQKNFIGRKTKLYAPPGCTLAKTPSTGPIKLVAHFGVEYVHTLRSTRKPKLCGQRVRLCIGGLQFSIK